jgi:hypothetical protein
LFASLFLGWRRRDRGQGIDVGKKCRLAAFRRNQFAPAFLVGIVLGVEDAILSASA